jgi:hypothetical protein
MSLVLHLLRWDVRRFRILLPSWLVLVAASAALEGAWPALAVEVAARETAGIASNLIALAVVLLSVLLAALVVQEHPLAGTNAFWLTRPIPPWSLLAAKLILLSVTLIAAPVFADIVLMLVYRVPSAQIAAVAAQTAISWALWLGPIMMLAALTPNLARFALVVGGFLVGIVVFLMTMMAILIDRFDEEPPMSGGSDIYDPTPGMVTTVLIIVAVIAVLIVLYRTRARARAVAIGIAGFAIAFGIGSAWPWPLLSPRTETPAWASNPSMLQLSAAPETVHIDNTIRGFRDRPPLWRVVRASVRLSGIAPGWSADIGVRETSVQIKGGEALTSRVPASRARLVAGGVPAEHDEAVRQLLNVERLVDRSQQSKADSVIVLYARHPDLQRVAPATGTYDGRFRVSLTRHDIEAILPLRRGAAHRNGAYRFVVDRIHQESGRVIMMARESDAVSVFGRHPRSGITFYLRNQYLSEATLGSHYEARSEIALARVLPFAIGVGESENSGFRPRALILQFPATHVEPGHIAFDSRWIERAELVIVRSTEGGAVERRLLIPELPIRAE